MGFYTAKLPCLGFYQDPDKQCWIHTKNEGHHEHSKISSIFYVVYHHKRGDLLVLAIIIGIIGLDLVYSVHGKLFHIPREALNVAYYSFLGLYKIVWLVFNAVPYLALLIIRKE